LQNRWEKSGGKGGGGTGQAQRGKAQKEGLGGRVKKKGGYQASMKGGPGNAYPAEATNGGRKGEQLRKREG